MARFEVLLRDRSHELVEADVYEQEGSMTTFFVLGDGREVIDCWATRVASVRTNDVFLVRRITDPAREADLRVVG